MTESEEEEVVSYEYERQLKAKWQREHELLIKAKNASSSTNNNETKERLKEIGIELRTEEEEDVQNTMIRNPNNFYPELSPDYELMKSTRKSRWG